MSKEPSRVICYKVTSTIETTLSDEELLQIKQDNCQRISCAGCPFEEMDFSTIRKTFTVQETK